ncbi:phage tail protein [uncultured Erythrobacter sp.]|uniref:phage tail protein n=1 Tax=uncultured Erythrobacter sp. TaxID=263913 RepID=UPI0026026394|nr:phage tail protein [uncultured Erythrobacter sp.]
MTRITPSFLSLLPPVYRGDGTLDGDNEIAAFTQLLDASRAEIERDIEELYDSWFVETCPGKSLPSRAALVGMQKFPASAHSSRRLVADQAGFAACKGTAKATCQALSSLGGWPCSIEYDAAQTLGRINVGQMRVQRLKGASPHFALSNDFGTAFWLHPLGFDTPLYRNADEGGVLSREVDTNELAAHVTIFRRNGAEGEWRKVPLKPTDLSGWEYGNPFDKGACIDPELGRLWIGVKNLKAEDLMVSFSLAAVLPESAEPTPSRFKSLAAIPGDDPDKINAKPKAWKAYIHRLVKPGYRHGVHHFTNLRNAILASANVSEDLHFHLLDSASHEIDEITFKDRGKNCPSQPNRERRVKISARAGERPVLRGDIVCVSEGRKLKLELCDLTLDGRLGLFGNVEAVLARTLLFPVSLWKRTAVPSPAILIDGLDSDEGGSLRASSSIIGATECWNRVTLSLADSIMDDPFRDAALSGSATVYAIRSTVLGPIEAWSIEAETCAFMGSLDIQGSHELGDSWVGLKSDTQHFVSTSLSQPGYGAPDRSLIPNLLVREAKQGDLGSTHSDHTGMREELIRNALGLDALRNAAEPSELLPLGLTVQVNFVQENFALHS